jgi:hypothetical protein
MQGLRDKYIDVTTSDRSANLENLHTTDATVGSKFGRPSHQRTANICEYDLLQKTKRFLRKLLPRMKLQVIEMLEPTTKDARLRRGLASSCLMSRISWYATGAGIVFSGILGEAQRI